ncbi:hypothetical protein ACP70R_037221 [Stipagrostis hirtigluma subsp. patula]
MESEDGIGMFSLENTKREVHLEKRLMRKYIMKDIARVLVSVILIGSFAITAQCARMHGMQQVEPIQEDDKSEPAEIGHCIATRCDGNEEQTCYECLVDYRHGRNIWPTLKDCVEHCG